MKSEYGAKLVRKDFDGWNELKKNLNSKNDPPQFKSSEIWWCSIGVNVGFEEDGKNENFERPVLIVRKYNKDLFVGLPMTSILKDNKFHYRLPDYKGSKSMVILSQPRVLSSNRLLRRVQFLDDKIFRDLMDKFTTLTLEKAKPPRVAGESRTANAGLYYNSSKVVKKSQGGRV